MGRDDERVLWTAGDVECAMISCCAGAELQLRTPETVLLRELYPTKSDLYERAHALRLAYPTGAEGARAGASDEPS